MIHRLFHDVSQGGRLIGRRSFWIALLFFAATFVSVATTRAETDERYAIGVVLPLSGPAASLGGYLRKGIELAYDQLSPAQQKKFKLVVEDDQLLPAKTAAAAQKLLHVEKARAFFVLGSGSANVAAPITERAKAILFAIGASDPRIVKRREYAFIHWVTPEVEAQKLVAEIKRRGYQKLGFVIAEQEGTLAQRDAITAELQAQGLQTIVAFSEQVLPNTTDFKAILGRAAQKKLDAVILAVYPGSIAAFAKQSRTLGFTADLIGVELFEDDNEVRAAEGALLDQWYVNADEGSSWFIDLYRQKYGEHPGWGAANAYDSLMLVVGSVERVGEDNRDIARYLTTIRDYPGAAGRYSATGDHRFSLPAAVKKVVSGGYEKIW